MFSKNTLILWGGFIFGVIFMGVAFYTYSEVQKRPGDETGSISAKTESQTQVKNGRESLARILQQFYLDEGLELEAVVEKTYPKVGFIIMDEQGARLFVYWKKELPGKGQLVSVKGNSYSTAKYIKRLRKERGFTQKLEDFLKNRPVFISAKQVEKI